MLEASFPAITQVAFLQPVHRCFGGIGLLGHSVAALNTALGVQLPATPHRVAAEGITYLWSGPSSWLAMSESTDLISELSQRAGQLAAITEQSDGLFTLRVIGSHVRDILAKLVPIDLHPSAFPPDAVALTLAGHINVRLWQEEDGAFALCCFRGFAGALHHALAQAGQEFMQ